MRSDYACTLYLRMFSRAAAKASPDWRAQPLLFALTANHGRIERTGEASLLALGALIARAKKIVLIMAASDVTLLHLAVPPLSPARLKIALPALVEDRLIADPAECVLAAGPDAGGMRTIGVIARDWLHEVGEMLKKSGAPHFHAYPAQACLPQPLHATAAPVTAAITRTQNHVDLALRLSAHEGLGLSLLAPAEENAQEDLRFETDLCRNLQTLAGNRLVECMVPTWQKSRYQSASAQLPLQEGEIVVTDDDWQKWISGAQQAAPDLMTGMDTGRTQRFAWQQWRWPLRLAGLLLLLNVIALYIDWWRLKQEGDALRAQMMHRILAAYPEARVTGDPLAYLQQKIGARRQASGTLSPDDFLMQAALLAESLNNPVAPAEKATEPGKSNNPNKSNKSNNTAVAALEYKNQALKVRFRPDVSPAPETARSIFSAHNLQLVVMPGQDGATVWQIRSAR